MASLVANTNTLYSGRPIQDTQRCISSSSSVSTFVTAPDFTRPALGIYKCCRFQRYSQETVPRSVDIPCVRIVEGKVLGPLVRSMLYDQEAQRESPAICSDSRVDFLEEDQTLLNECNALWQLALRTGNLFKFAQEPLVHGATDTAAPLATKIPGII